MDQKLQKFKFTLCRSIYDRLKVKVINVVFELFQKQSTSQNSIKKNLH